MPLTPAIVQELLRILGADGLVTTPEGRMVYEADMHTFYKGAPDAVALPRTTAQVQAVVKLCRRESLAVVPRGSGTGLIGGAMAPKGGVMVSVNRMDGVLEVDLPNRCAVVQPGLINLWLTKAIGDRGYFFAPDPSSQMVSSIGGNVATNAGGPHCLKYGVTTNHVLGLEIVTGTGNLVRVGGKVVDGPGYDPTGVVVGRGWTVRSGVGDQREWDRAGGAGDARRRHHQRHQRQHRQDLPGCRRRGAAHRARWTSRRGRGAGRARRHHLPPSRRRVGQCGRRRDGAGAPVEGAEGSRGRRRAAHVLLSPPGRRGPALEAAPDHARDESDRGAPSGDHRQRVSRRRRKPPSAHLLRRSQRRGSRARQAGQRRAARRLHRARWLGYR